MRAEKLCSIEAVVVEMVEIRFGNLYVCSIVVAMLVGKWQPCDNFRTL
jgi:hypothetical protein